MDTSKFETKEEYEAYLAKCGDSRIRELEERTTGLFEMVKGMDVERFILLVAEVVDHRTDDHGVADGATKKAALGAIKLAAYSLAGKRFL